MSLRMITLAGTPLEMGRQHGEQLPREGREMITTRLRLASEAAQKVAPRFDEARRLALADECVPYLRQYSPAVYEEFMGMAEALELSPAELVIGNGWTDFSDLLSRRTREALHECTSVALFGEMTADGRTYVAQTWDMNVTAGPYMVLVRREPEDGPVSLSLTTAGCLSLIGINEAGIAVGNTNLAPCDARAGVFYLALIHEALAQTDFGRAVDCITRARRLSGHYYYLGGPEGQFCGIETTGERHQVVQPERRYYAHTNHYLERGLMDGPATAGGNSQGRLARMTALAEGLEGGVTVEDMGGLLRDHEGEHPICRHCDEPTGAATLGAAVMCPQARTIWAVAGNPCEGDFEAHQL